MVPNSSVINENTPASAKGPVSKFNLDQIEITGAAVSSFFGGLGAFQSIADRILGELSFASKRADGTYYFDPERWYSAALTVRMFFILKERVGTNTLRQAGRSIPDNAIFPPDVDTIYKGLASIDIAYHMNHRHNGQPMFNPETGEMKDLIGHYRMEPIEGKREIHMICDTPYPGEFDEGIVTAMARRFENSARVVLHPDRPNRLNGGDACTFVVTW